MASQFDESDFIDSDYQSTKAPYAASSAQTGADAAFMNRPPTREELDNKVGEAQQKLLELKRAQEELERERGALEEARRRRIEFHTGRDEMLQNLTRGVGVIEEAEFDARRDAEQMAKTLLGMREALEKLQVINEESWNQENWNIELTRALTVIENARMEWNSARLKWPQLNGVAESGHGVAPQASGDSVLSQLENRSFLELSRIGLALTWPLVAIGLIALVFAFFLVRR